jgi:DNA-directed RNA polymerase specialized sigma24 family protein
MSQPNEIEQLLQRLRDDDPDAPNELVARYGRELRFVIRRRLDRRARSFMDSEDVLQMVWSSVFRCLTHNDPQWIETDEDLKAFLCGCAFKKTLMASRSARAEMRNPDRVVPIDTLLDRQSEALCDPHPGPEEVAVRRDLLENVLGQLEGAQLVLAQHVLKGRSLAEIARCTRTDERAVRKMFKRVVSLAEEHASKGS